MVFGKEQQREEETGGVYGTTTAITAASVRGILQLAQSKKQEAFHRLQSRKSVGEGNPNRITPENFYLWLMEFV